MVTNYPQRLTATTDMTATHTETGLLARAIGRIGQMMCGLRGHDSVLHFEGKRVMMRCTSCGHDTPGGKSAGARRVGVTRATRAVTC